MYVGYVRLADHYIHVDDINIENKNRTRFKTETEKKTHIENRETTTFWHLAQLT